MLPTKLVIPLYLDLAKPPYPDQGSKEQQDICHLPQNIQTHETNQQQNNGIRFRNISRNFNISNRKIR